MKVIVGKVGRLWSALKPQPTHVVEYAPGMKNEPSVKEARAAVQAGRGRARVSFTKHRSKQRWA